MIIRKVLESAIANAEHNDGADVDELSITQHLRRARRLPAALPRPVKGRGARIMKPTCNIMVTVGDGRK